MTRRSTAALLVAAWLPLVLAARHARPSGPLPRSNSWQPAAVTPARTPGSPDGLMAVSFARDGTGTAVGTEGGIWKSSDAGRSWRQDTALPARQPQSGSIRRLCLIDESIVLAVSTVGAAAVLLRSSDSGQTWSVAVESGTLFFDCAVSSTGWVVAVGIRGTILRSADSGRTWEAVPSGTGAALRSVAFAGHVAVTVGVGGRILRSSDGGDTWTQIPSGTSQHLRSVAFVDETHGVAVGAWGTMVRTDDAGLTWRTEPSGVRAHLAEVVIAPDGSPIAVGSLGTILRGRPLTGRDSSSAVEGPR